MDPKAGGPINWRLVPNAKKGKRERKQKRFRGAELQSDSVKDPEGFQM
jgi:hypothetical protein